MIITFYTMSYCTRASSFLMLLLRWLCMAIRKIVIMVYFSCYQQVLCTSVVVKCGCACRMRTNIARLSVYARVGLGLLSGPYQHSHFTRLTSTAAFYP